MYPEIFDAYSDQSYYARPERIKDSKIGKRTINNYK